MLSRSITIACTSTRYQCQDDAHGQPPRRSAHVMMPTPPPVFAVPSICSMAGRRISARSPSESAGLLHALQYQPRYRHAFSRRRRPPWPAPPAPRPWLRGRRAGAASSAFGPRHGRRRAAAGVKQPRPPMKHLPGPARRQAEMINRRFMEHRRRSYGRRLSMPRRK